MSNEFARRVLIDEVVDAVRDHQGAVDAVDDAASAFLGINRTDGRCLDIIDRRGRVTAGELASETGLTCGAITTALDRLQTAGYVRRLRDHSDRRRVLVEMTDLARSRAWEVLGPVAEEGVRILKNYDDDQLTTIRDFLWASRDLLQQYAAGVRATAASNKRVPQQEEIREAVDH
jgi:DNA-binding MarR family transcriptional regulator